MDQRIPLEPGERVDDLQYKGMGIIQHGDKFRFGTDAVLLAAYAKVSVRERVADLGCGTGIIGLLLAGRNPTAAVTGLEIQPEMAAMAVRSVAMNGLDDRMHIVCGDIREAAKLLGYNGFDMAVCNPPYGRPGGTVSEREDEAMARHEVSCTMDDIAAAMYALLRNGGRGYVIYPADRIKEVLDVFHKRRMQPKRIRLVHHTIDRAPKFLLLEAVREGNPGIHWQVPWILYDQDGKMTETAERIYHKGNSYMTETGTLYIVGTPIGNLEDITLRALRILKEVDIIAAEDTRHTLNLLNHFDMPKKLVSYHEHNQRESGERLLSDLLEGKQVALVTDAGMPCVSDPGWELVNAAHEAKIPVLVIPGPTAMASAIAWSGMDAGRFVFEGFLPREGKPRRERLHMLKTEPRTMVFYEAPHRLEKTLKELLAELGDRRAALCKDITKFFERVNRGSISELLLSWPEDRVRGEYVIIVEGLTGEQLKEQSGEDIKNMTIQDHLRMVMNLGVTRNEAIKRVATERGLPRRDVYQVSITGDKP